MGASSLLVIVGALLLFGVRPVPAQRDAAWQIATIVANQSIVASGGLAADAQGQTLFVSDKSQRAIWKLDLKSGQAELLSGLLDLPPGITDGPAGTATFSQPRGLCLLSHGGGQLLVVDGIGSAAVLRLVSSATGEVTTVLGSSSSAGSHDGPGSQAALSSGSWLLTCLPDGSALLADSQTRMIRRVCPPAWHGGDCGGQLPPSRPTPSPGPGPGPAPAAAAGGGDGGGRGGAWWQLLLAACGGAGVLLAGQAGYAGATGFVSRRISALRAKHARPRISYEVLPGGVASRQLTAPAEVAAQAKMLSASGRRTLTRGDDANSCLDLEPAAGQGGAASVTVSLPLAGVASGHRLDVEAASQKHAVNRDGQTGRSQQSTSCSVACASARDGAASASLAAASWLNSTAFGPVLQTGSSTASSTSGVMSACDGGAAYEPLGSSSATSDSATACEHTGGSSSRRTNDRVTSLQLVLACADEEGDGGDCTAGPSVHLSDDPRWLARPPIGGHAAADGGWQGDRRADGSSLAGFSDAESLLPSRHHHH